MSKESEQKTIKKFCPTCLGERQLSVHGELHSTIELEPHGGNTWYHEHLLVRCLGCKTAFHIHSDYTQDDVYPIRELLNGEVEYDVDKTDRFWPSKAPDLIQSKIDDHVLPALLEELYTAYRSRSYFLTAIALRTVFDRITEILKIDPTLTFAQKLKELLTDGHVTQNEHDALSILVDASSAAVHRGWTPKPKELDDLVLLMESFIRKIFSAAPDVSKIKIPAKPRRKSK